MQKQRLLIWFSRCLLLLLIPLISSGETPVGGSVEGVWWPSGNPYVVQSTLIIQPLTTLVIMPGVEIEFLFPDSIKVYGSLVAQGTEQDSVYMRDAEKPVWRGIWFLSGSHDCLLEYVSIQRPKWGVRASNASPTIRFCTIKAQSIGVGGQLADFSLIASVISVDASESIGINLFHSDAYIQGCRILALETITAQNAIGVKIIQSDPEIWYCWIDVQASGLGCGIWAEETYKSSIRYNLIQARADYLAFGSYLILSGPFFINNTVVVSANSTFGKCLYLNQNSDPIVDNCILFGDGMSWGIDAEPGCNPEVRYTDLYNHAQNAVGCSVSVGSISQDPEFENASAHDYSLMRSSPCINAGDPATPYDPDGSVADMGCFFYDLSVGIEPEPDPFIPSQYPLIQAFPNPFNASGSLLLTLPSAQFGQLMLYDQFGRRVAVLRSDLFPEGQSRIAWNSQGHGSGIYYVVFQGEKDFQVQSICLLK